MICGARAHACRVRIVENTGLGWTNAKWGGPPGPRPTPTSACCWYLSMLEVAGPGGPARTRGSTPLRWSKVFIRLDGLQAHEIHSRERLGFSRQLDRVFRDRAWPQ